MTLSIVIQNCIQHIKECLLFGMKYDNISDRILIELDAFHCLLLKLYHSIDTHMSKSNKKLHKLQKCFKNLNKNTINPSLVHIKYNSIVTLVQEWAFCQTRLFFQLFKKKNGETFDEKKGNRAREIGRENITQKKEAS